MKLLHMIPSFYPAYVYGGPILSTYELCQHSVKLGCEVRVLTTDANGLGHVLEVEKDREVPLEEGFRVRYCRRRLRHSVSPTLLRLLPQYVSWADVVHLTGVYNFPTFPTLLHCRRQKRPLVWSPRGALQRWAGSSRRVPKALWDALWYSGADLSRLSLHVTSTQENQEVLARFPKLHTVMIPNGVQVPMTLDRTQPAENLRLLFIGRLDPKKGIETLLKACGLLVSNGLLNWRLTIAGWGVPAYVEQIKTLVADIGLEERVHMVGEVLGEAKKKLFESSDLALVPSHTENFGIVVAEALAHAVPVIASKATPWSGLEDKQCGLWVNNDPETVANAIRKASRMPLSEMGLRGREWMRKEFSWASVTEQMMDLYEKKVRECSELTREGAV